MTNEKRVKVIDLFKKYRDLPIDKAELDRRFYWDGYDHIENFAKWLDNLNIEKVIGKGGG